MKDNKDKSIKIELDSFLVSVCRNKDLQPFSNTFHFEGENPAQHKLGEIFGVIKIKDHSEESAYLPNLLSQVAKREFFLKPNRGTEESFSAALNKVNLALADLAEHDVTNWINKLDAVVGVINENDFHFTKLGDGQIFLSKNRQVVNISDGLNEEENVHPVKTFSDISSGMLSIDDKVIFSTKNLFNSLSWDEITRHTKTFTSNEFDNILKSTIDLEGKDVGVAIVNIKEKSVLPIKEVRSTKNLNFFGESELFSAKKSLGKRCYSLKDKTPDSEKVSIEITKENPTDAVISSLIPKKTQNGAISLSKGSCQKEKESPSVKEKEKSFESFSISPFEEHPELFIKETDEEDDKFVIEKVDKETERKLNSVLNKVKQTLEELKKNPPITPNSISLISKFKLGKPNENIKEMSFNDAVSYPIEPSEEAYKKEALEIEKKKIRKEKESMRLKNESIRAKEEQNFKKMQTELRSFANKIKCKLKSVGLKNLFFGIIKNIKNFYTISYKNITKLLISAKKDSSLSKNKVSKKIKKTLASGNENDYGSKQFKISVFFAKLSRKFSPFIKIKKRPTLKKLVNVIKNFLNFINSYKKIALAIAGLLIIGVILFSVFFGKGDSNEVLNFKEQELDVQKPSFGNQIEATTIASLDSEIQSIAGDEDELFIYTTAEKFFRLNITNNELSEIPLKNSAREIKYLVSMPTLRLIFLISENYVFSYSPVVNRLTDVDINLPENLEIGGVGVYLQYLYLLDKESNNIYRFPRKPGGFSNYKIRIADQQFFSTSTDLAVDDSLLVASENGEIQQYFEGKLKTSFSAKIKDYEDSRIVDIETSTDPNNIYALDSKNGIISKIPKGNQTDTETFFNQKFVDAEHIWINQKQDRVFVATKNGEILRISL